ncbi:MAG: hypothetical protein ACOC2H_07930 [Spirochaetota bacterium]
MKRGIRIVAFVLLTGLISCEITETGDGSSGDLLTLAEAVEGCGTD